MTIPKVRVIKNLIKAFGSKFVSSSKTPKVIVHPLGEKNKRRALLWQYDKAIEWAYNQDYVLEREFKALNDFEKLDREILAAEYSVCQEISARGGTVLDNGCGVGRHIKVIMESHFCNIERVIGIDIGLKLLKRAKEELSNKNYSNKIELHRSSVENLPFIPDSSVDFAIAMYRIFGNLKEEIREKNLQEIERKLKRRGNYILSLGNKKYMKAVTNYYKKFTGPPNLYNYQKGDVVYGDGIRQHYFTRKEIASLFPRRGFFVERFYEAGTNFIVWLSPNS